MKQFFKTMFASVFGALIAMGIFLMAGIAFLAGVVASSSSSSTYKPAKRVCFLLRTTSGFGGFQIRREVHSLVRRRLFARWILLGERVRFAFC